ncbi:MAG: ATP-binding protein [Candidatus Zhuqueibacterota bacterium]
MIFTSFYPRIIFILATISLVLFTILALINTLFFRNEFLTMLSQLEQPRIDRLFADLDKYYASEPGAEKIRAKIDSMFFEFNVELFDSAAQRITGVYPKLPELIVPEQSYELHEKKRLTGFSRIYYNPNSRSRFYAVKIRLRFINTPISNKIFFNFLMSGIIVILVSAALGYRLVAYLINRLDRLKTGVSKLAKGEFDVRLEDNGNDEIAFLARSFNHMSRQLQKTIESLEESNAARQRLLAHASHEIKSPLTSIKGFIDIVEFMNILSKDQRQNLLPVVKKDLNRVVKITNDMLQLTRIRDPQYHLNLKPIDLQEFLVEEHSYFGNKASAIGALAVYTSSIEGKVMLNTDSERLSQILDNLWNNALKYGDLSHPIRTAFGLRGDMVEIKVANALVHRIDIPVEQLFEPFYRGAATSDRVSGSGLGLAIVKELMEKLNGAIETKLTSAEIEISLLFTPQ